MNLNKFSRQKQLNVDNQIIQIEGPILEENLRDYTFHPELTSFRSPDEQQHMLKKIAQSPEGRIIIARYHQLIIGYVAFSFPDSKEHWSKINMSDLLELGAIEVAPPFRGKQIAKQLLEVSLSDPFMENYIIITTLYYWHWDLKRTGLSIWQYRRIMENVMKSAGLNCYATDEPEIRSHPANSLMARIGKNVPKASIEKFDELRFYHG